MESLSGGAQVMPLLPSLQEQQATQGASDPQETPCGGMLTDWMVRNVLQVPRSSSSPPFSSFACTTACTAAPAVTEEQSEVLSDSNMVVVPATSAARHAELPPRHVFCPMGQRYSVPVSFSRAFSLQDRFGCSHCSESWALFSQSLP